MEEVKRCLSFTFHWPPNFGSFQWPPSLEPSIGHQALDPSIGHQALDPPSPPFSFSLKGGLGSWRGSLGHEDNFHAILSTCLTSFLKREIMFSLGGGKKEEKENENLVIVLEGWDSR